MTVLGLFIVEVTTRAGTDQMFVLATTAEEAVVLATGRTRSLTVHRPKKNEHGDPINEWSAKWPFGGVQVLQVPTDGEARVVLRTT